MKLALKCCPSCLSASSFRVSTIDLLTQISNHGQCKTFASIYSCYSYIPLHEDQSAGNYIRTFRGYYDQEWVARCTNTPYISLVGNGGDGQM